MMADKYVLIVEYEDYDPDFDHRIENAIGRKRNGSGYGEDGRDISFGFSQKPAAKRALARARRFRKYNCSSYIADAKTYEKIDL